MARFVAIHSCENKILSIPFGVAFTFGRKGSCNVVESDLAISGVHCTVTCSLQPNGLDVEIQDSSSNGTFVNEKLIGKGKTATVREGDLIDLAKPKDGIPLVRYRVEIDKTTSPTVTTDDMTEARLFRDKLDDQKLQLSIQIQKNEITEKKLVTAVESLQATKLQLEIELEEKAVLQLKLQHNLEQNENLKAELSGAFSIIKKLEGKLKDAECENSSLTRENMNVHAKVENAVAAAELLAQDFSKKIECLLSGLRGSSEPRPSFGGYIASTLPDNFPSSPASKRARLSPVSETSSIADLADMLDIQKDDF